ERFRAVATALSEVTDRAERDRIGQELLGKAYHQLGSSIDEGIGKTRDANKMTKETIDTLDWLGDKLLETGTKAKNFFGTALAEAINIPRNTLNAMNHDLEQLGISIESVIAKSAKVPDLFKGQSRDQITPHRLSADEEKAVVEELNHIRKAH